MDSKEVKILLDKYLEGKATEVETALLETWYVNYKTSVHSEINVEFIGESVDRIWGRLDQQATKKMQLWQRYIGIAAAVIGLAVCVYFYTNNKEELTGRQPELVLASQDIAPGKNTATLTLANGKTITLSDTRTGVVIGTDKLVYNDGSELGTPQGAGGTGDRMLVMATPKGGTYQAILPDGTKVWLNAASKISFPAEFAGAVRDVVLSGEAYFEVSKDKKRPFVVSSKGQEVTVLGTHFNLNSYADETVTKTTLVEGRVRVASTGGARSIVLEPNQQSILEGNKITIRQANVEEDLDWKNGIFIFKGETIESIMRKVSRWYNVEVIYEPGMRKDLVFGGYVSRSLKISSVLRIMERTGKVKFKIADNRVYVKN